jgi:glutamate synthase (NADPH/NADH) large chain
MGLTERIEHELAPRVGAAMDAGKLPFHEELVLNNVQRGFGATTSHEVAKRYGGAGLPDDSIVFTLTVCS